MREILTVAETRTRVIQRKLRDLEGSDDLELASDIQLEADDMEQVPMLTAGEDDDA